MYEHEYVSTVGEDKAVDGGAERNISDNYKLI